MPRQPPSSSERQRSLWHLPSDRDVLFTRCMQLAAAQAIRAHGGIEVGVHRDRQRKADNAFVKTTDNSLLDDQSDLGITPYAGDNFYAAEVKDMASIIQRIISDGLTVAIPDYRNLLLSPNSSLQCIPKSLTDLPLPSFSGFRLELPETVDLVLETGICVCRTNARTQDDRLHLLHSDKTFLHRPAPHSLPDRRRERPR
ncbi:hypothetical protein EVAR_54057_1 [Eumeta japonica]|uniref:Uncharacterized protein n=1 Tax=Eumeta variegata TaxID=151549 RepID=A0A4C1XGB2_EUMVA|nr:hypothetical protein EVAR_54057_1 [Eumeta japonica]